MNPAHLKKKSQFNLKINLEIGPTYWVPTLLRKLNQFVFIARKDYVNDEEEEVDVKSNEKNYEITDSSLPEFLKVSEASI